MVQLENHAKTREVIKKYQEIIKVLLQERDNLNVLLKTVALEVRAHNVDGTRIKGYLAKAFASIKKL